MHNTFLGLTTLAILVAAHGPIAMAADRHSSSASTERVPTDAQQIIQFWREAGPDLWFAKNAEFDRRFRERFITQYEAAARGELAAWSHTADGALALIILLDQFPRNSFRGTPRMYDTDPLARHVAEAAIAAGYDRAIEKSLRTFMYLPFAHSESLADQERCVLLAKALSPDDLAHAQHHRDIIKRFGRFPHRNAILGRVSTRAEQDYLANGGYKG